MRRPGPAPGEGGASGYAAGVIRTVRAFHVMPGADGPEGRRHAHDYRVEAEARRAALDAAGMVCDLDLLGAALDEVAGTLRDRDLDPIAGSGHPAVTVEVLAAWVHRTLAARLAEGGPESLRIVVWESPDAYAAFTAPVPAPARR